jgi:hypothetical protein
MTRSGDSKYIKVDDALPIPARRVVVISEKFRVLGYVSRDGIWRDSKNKELKDVIGWQGVMEGKSSVR